MHAILIELPPVDETFAFLLSCDVLLSRLHVSNRRFAAGQGRKTLSPGRGRLRCTR
ncbi:hypothetical protein PLANPX_0347 [Lacipirellula parvula]|uniref:Uncharacterized protein n=1 Tax=Lacipirellula parvula TaxID=2650471 RepID=A0A5K7X317_9BACT|nr:hypothetical protein PLANPX_0347 [Lacipirellula parvula]